MYENLIGKRIKLLDMKDDPSFGKTLNKGDLGTVEDVYTVNMIPPFTQIWVNFDNGVSIALLSDADKFEVV